MIWSFDNLGVIKPDFEVVKEGRILKNLFLHYLILS